MEENKKQQPESLLPYDDWTEEALRQVVARALAHAAADGLPGEHHFYVTFRTDHPGVVIPPRLQAQYPQEMTIVLQHQFWDLAVDRRGRADSRGPVVRRRAATLVIPLAAVTGVRRSVRAASGCGSRRCAGGRAASRRRAASPRPAGADDEPAETPQVVSLDAFRRRTPPKAQDIARRDERARCRGPSGFPYAPMFPLGPGPHAVEASCRSPASAPRRCDGRRCCESRRRR